MIQRLFVFALVLTVPALCQTDRHPKKSDRAKAKISRADATKTALAKEPGKVKSSELETENGILVYSFDIQTKTGIHEVQVDALSGRIVSDKIESPEDEAKEKAAEKAEKKKKAEKTH